MNLKALLASTIFAVAASGVAHATDFTASQWLPPTYAQSIHAYKNFFDRVREKTNGEVNVEVYYSGSLLPAKTTMTGVRDGVADIGFLYPAYTPAELPVETFINSANFTSTDSLAAALAYTELGYTNPTMIAEYDNYNVVFGGAYVTPLYLFMCNTEVKNLEEAKGKRFRTAGASFTGLAEKLGGTAVSVPIGDVYSGMQRGNIDCVMADPTNLVSASFNEVVKNITTVKMGGSTGALWVFRKDSWAKISEENRKLMLDEMVRALVATHDEWTKQVTASFADAKERGIAVTEPDEDLANLLADYKKEFIANVVGSSDGVADAQALLDEYNNLQAKWTGLLNGVDRSDNEAVIAVVSKELLGKIDPATYGMK
ncbi:C4-dicarboxylate TRAP transporter substrate-binding protein [Zhengella mangrovi]|nr:C4-dicarboxylate TRAP transporter substrate-binding protein [Zhengella mangrovi]